MTTLFISHGAPTLAIEPGATGQLLAELGQSLPKPDAILVISAHWDTNSDERTQFKISTAPKPETIHDFGGFPKAMYQIQYPATGAVKLANETAALLNTALNSAGIKVEVDEKRGLDHGAWVPLMLMYPNAEIPVTQLSINTKLNVETHIALGKTISQLQDRNVMILCSGAITHNLHDFHTMQRDIKPLQYVPEFTDWIAESLANNQIETLADYRKHSQHGVRAHPTQDHILPFFVALGAGRGKAKRHQPETTFGFLAMDVYVW